MTIDERFKKIVADIFRISEKKIKNSTDFVQDLHSKSIDVIALTAATEGEFGIKVLPADARDNKTVGQTITYIKKKLKK